MIESQPFRPEQIIEVSVIDIPKAVAKHLWMQTMANGLGISIEEFDQLLRLESGDQIDTFFGHRFFDEAGYTEHRLNLVDINKQEQIMGFGEVNWSKPLRGRTYELPSVSDTNTNPEYAGKGVGRRRILAMQAACLAIYGKPLSSDHSFSSPYARQIWERLVAEGHAEEYEDNAHELEIVRYKFKS